MRKAANDTDNLLAVKQGRKFNNPSSRKAIKHFIAFHNLPLDESGYYEHQFTGFCITKGLTVVLEPLDSFGNFNEFFYRKLKLAARTLASPSDPKVAVSAADCRFSCFASVDRAKTLWIKGRDFTIPNLLQDDERVCGIKDLRF